MHTAKKILINVERHNHSTSVPSVTLKGDFGSSNLTVVFSLGNCSLLALRAAHCRNNKNSQLHYSNKAESLPVFFRSNNN